MTAGSHVSIPKPFSSGDVVEWFQRFDLYSDANNWEDEVKAVKMPTLLEGEALAAWLDLAEETIRRTTRRQRSNLYRRAHADRLYALGQISRQEITTGRVFS